MTRKLVGIYYNEKNLLLLIAPKYKQNIVTWYNTRIRSIHKFTNMDSNSWGYDYAENFSNKLLFVFTLYKTIDNLDSNI